MHTAFQYENTVKSNTMSVVDIVIIEGNIVIGKAL